IRFTSPHPLHMDDEFIEEFAKNPKICKSMHVPLQSGSTEILKEMKRGYSQEWFLNRVAKLREMAPNVSISTDIIVGFPGESDADFEETMKVAEEVGFEQMFSFKYSPRPLTEAAEYENAVDAEVASDRLHRLQALQDTVVDKVMQSQVGKVYDVYFEELRAEGYVAGRSSNNFLVKVKGSEELLGQIRDVKITSAARMSLTGELLA
ncbi:MAG: radical SAM protein, partial [Sulfurimonadaceae bacterium]